MQKNNIIIKTALAIIAAVLTTGCIFEKMDMPKDLQNVLIELSVSTDAITTKADPLASESAINTLHVYAFNGNALIGYAERGSTLVGDPFLMDLLLPELVPGGDNEHAVDFYLIANASSMLYENVPYILSENTTRAELDALKFTGLAAGAPLPLYCMQTETVNVAQYVENEVDGHKGHMLLAKKAHFELSRSLAKISIYAAKPENATTSPEILSVTMLAAGTREYSYLFSQDDDVIKAVPSRSNNRAFLSYAVPVEAAISDADRANPEKYTPVMTAPTYLAEVAVGSADWSTPSEDERAVVLRIEYALRKGGVTRTADVYMPPIIRNNHYKVLCLISSKDEGKIIINYVVEDWTGKEVSYSFDYPTHSYLRASLPTDQDEAAAKPASAARMSDGNPFVGYFRMTAPDTESWTPTLLGDYASLAEIKVYRQNGDIEDTRPVKASEEWYRIEVTPKTGENGMKAGNSVNLAITYMATVGFTHSEYLLINGSAGEYYWPESTDANFVTITMTN